MADTFLGIFKGFIILCQGFGWIALSWSLMQCGYKAIWKKEKRGEIKDDLLWSGGGLILILACMPIAQYIETQLKF